MNMIIDKNVMNKQNNLTYLSPEKMIALENQINYDICCTTGRLYAMANNLNFELHNFSDAFLSSVFCHQYFDTKYSPFQLEDEDVSMAYFLKEVDGYSFTDPRWAEGDYNVDKSKLPKSTEETKLSEDCAFWIGFIYRYLYIKTGIESTILKEKVPFEYLRKKSYGLLTIDENNAVDIICNDCKLNIESNEKIQEI